ncbi:MAG: Uma2 family endonuclease [Cyanothece sp. SIO2G6]|nr:Uma2 family endonuclease [Cyanothece sp. SIO2G6]
MFTTILINLPKTLHVTNDQFIAFVHANPDLKLERTATGELIVISPTGSESGNHNSELTTDVTLWNRQAQLGKVFDSSTGFRLPNGATRSPDVAWVKQERWETLTPDQRQGFAPLCPDFVIELISKADDVATLRDKMQEYVNNGCRLGWLIIPQTQTVEIYRQGQAVETVSFSTKLSGESVLPGFELDLQSLFA